MAKLNVILPALLSLLVLGGMGYEGLRDAEGGKARNVVEAANESMRKSLELVGRADRLRAQGHDLPQAVRLYHEAISMADSYPAREGLALALLDDGRTIEARGELQEFLGLLKARRMAKGATDLTYLLDLGDACARAGLPQDAQAIYVGMSTDPHQIDARFKTTLDVVPAHARTNALIVVGIGKMRSGKRDEAVERFEEAARERPTWGMARFMVAYANEYAGHNNEAERQYARAAALGVARPKGFRRLRPKD